MSLQNLTDLSGLRIEGQGKIQERNARVQGQIKASAVQGSSKSWSFISHTSDELTQEIKGSTYTLGHAYLSLIGFRYPTATAPLFSYILRLLTFIFCYCH